MVEVMKIYNIHFNVSGGVGLAVIASPSIDDIHYFIKYTRNCDGFCMNKTQTEIDFWNMCDDGVNYTIYDTGVEAISATLTLISAIC